MKYFGKPILLREIAIGVCTAFGLFFLLLTFGSFRLSEWLDDMFPGRNE